MQVRIEISDAEEIIIRCKENNEKIKQFASDIEMLLNTRSEILLTIGDTEYFIPKNSILFFESYDGKVYAHTADKIFTAPYKLFELESMMSASFIRVSKSAIVNILHIESIRREIVGNGELTFKGSDKKTYFSRVYFKLLQYKIDEMRFKK